MRNCKLPLIQFALIVLFIFQIFSQILFSNSAYAQSVVTPSATTNRATNCPAGTVAKPRPNNSNLEFGNCAARYTRIPLRDYELTTKLVTCLEGTMRAATIGMLAVISREFGWVTSVLATLVIAFFGVRIASGERDLLKRASILFVKLAVIVIFMNMLPTIVDWTFEILRDLLRLVSRGYSPWRQIDALLGNLLGFGPAITIINGLIGLIGAAIFSSSVGLVMFFFGMLAILNMLIFIMELIYTYALAFMIISFLLMLSPIMVPLALFFYTERMFRKWIDIIISAIITPVLLFAFVSVFIGVFDILVNNIFEILGGNNFRAYWRINTSLFSWLIPSDINTNVYMQNLPTGDDVPCVDRTATSAVQSNIDPLKQNSSDAGVPKVATLNFGANEVYMIQRLSFAFMTLWIFASLMKSMLHLIPEVAAGIAQATNNISFGAESTMVAQAKGAVDKTRSSLTNAASKDPDKFKNLNNIGKELAKLVGARDK